MTPIRFRQARTGSLIVCILLASATALLSVDSPQATRTGATRKGGAASGTKTGTGLSTPDPEHKAKILSEFGRLPLQFEANIGQAGPQVQFIARSKQYDLFLLPDEIVFAIPTVAPGVMSPDTALRTPSSGREIARAKSGSYVRMSLAGARQSQIVGKQRLPGVVNYFIGNDPQKWRTGVPLFAAAEYPKLIPGVDLDFHGVRERAEFDLVVHPGTDVSSVNLSFDGVRKLKIDKSGDLLVSCGAGQLRLLKPVAYQEIKGARVPVDARFALRKHNQVAFRVGLYDKTRELVIDPSVVYSSYLGGTSQDEALGVAVDSRNAAYITGATSSPDFPQSGSQFTGTIDGFVTKVEPNGYYLEFSTFFGGSSTTFATALAVLDQPNSSAPGVYITGYTDSSDLPLPPGGAQGMYAGGLDAFVWILDLSGSLPLGGTYLGGNKDDVGTGISVDLDGYSWVVGYTSSPPGPFPKFPITGNALQPNLNNGKGGDATDGFVAQVSPSAQSFIFCTYLGGSKQDVASAVAIDDPYSDSRQYNVYVTGATNSPDFPTTPGAFQTKCGTDSQCNGGQNDAFITAISHSPGQFSYDYSTYLGGEREDDGYGIAAETSGNAFVTGRTSSNQFPTTSSAYQGSLRGQPNAFVTEIDPSGSVLAYSTFLGGSAKDAGLGIAVDGNSNIYVTGRTLSPDFPTLNATQPAIGGNQDAFVSTFVPLNNLPTLAFSTFLGGSGDEDLAGGGIAVDESQNAYVVGDTNSGNFTVSSGAFQPNFEGSGNCTIGGVQAPCEDAFITKISTSESPTLTVNMTGTGVATVSSAPQGITCSQIPGTCRARFNFGTQITLTEQASNTTFNGWSGGGCSGTGDCVLILTSDQTVSADFTLNQTNVTLTVVIAGNGHGQVAGPSGFLCSQGTCTGNFNKGTQITLTATPGSDSAFTGWSDLDCQGTGPCTFTLNSATTISATFTLDEPVLTVIAEGDPGSGVVISTPGGIKCTAPMTCTATFPMGTVVTLTPQGLSGHAFTGWNSSVCSGTGPCTFTLNANQLVKADFFDGLDVALPGTGSGRVVSDLTDPNTGLPAIDCPKNNCSAAFDTGTTVTLTATPNSSSTFDGWGGAAASCGTNTTCPVSINQPLVTVSATFTLIYVPPPPPFNFTASPVGGATIPVGGSAAYGLSVVSINGFTDTISLTCSVQPASQSSPACTLTPSSFTLGADQAGSSTLTISAGGLAARNIAPGNGRLASFEIAATMLMFSFVSGLWTIPANHSRRRRRNRASAALLIVLAALAIQVGCGGGSKSSGSANSGSNAQPGNYVVTVTATGSISQVSRTITIPVTVQ